MAALLLWLGIASMLAVLAGLYVRGHAARAVTLAPLLIAMAASAALVGLYPACSTWSFWFAKELLHAVLFVVLGVELALRVFVPLPRARRLALAWTAAVLLGLAAALLAAPSGPRMVEVLPRIAAATAWQYGGLTLLMWLASWRAALETDDLHRSLLVGFALYTMFYAATWGRSADDTTIAGLANPLVFDLVMLLLLRAAWQRPPLSLGPPRA
jgi:hypothetical protein